MTVEYKRDNGACVPLRVHTVVISVQHRDGTSLEEMRVALREQVAKVCMAYNYTIYTSELHAYIK